VERLDSLETMARQRPASGGAAGGIANLERTLQEKLDHLEEARRQLCAEAQRQQDEWSASLTRLEADRRRLAEAWERVERERIDGLGAAGGQPHLHAESQGPPRGSPATFVHATAPGPARSAAADSDPNNPVARAILRQFQALCRDVRCNAEARRDSP
jgi:hypothetical protein